MTCQTSRHLTTQVKTKNRESKRKNATVKMDNKFWNSWNMYTSILSSSQEKNYTCSGSQFQQINLSVELPFVCVHLWDRKWICCLRNNNFLQCELLATFLQANPNQTEIGVTFLQGISHTDLRDWRRPICWHQCWNREIPRIYIWPSSGCRCASSTVCLIHAY